MTEIAASACNGLKKLISLSIGKNVKIIGAKAFYGCSKLKTINILTTKLTAKNVGSNAFKKVNKKATYTCPKKKLTAYQSLLLEKGVSKSSKIQGN